MIEETTLPRVLSGTSARPRTWEQHLAVFGPPPAGASLSDQLDEAGLRGRGGGAFATARKVRHLRDLRGRHKFVVVNAMEGEPASHKDLTLASTNPHLILDGAQYLAHAIGANRIAVCAARDNPRVINHLQRAIHERERSGTPKVAFELQTPPWRYVAGEESALVHWLDDHEALPQYRPDRPHVARIGQAPVLVDNAETCAHVALIHRYGAAWYRALGTEGSPGSTLVSVSGAVARPVVLEVALGATLREILDAAHAVARPRAVLLGGYGGSWLDGSLLDVPYTHEDLEPLGASIGAGVIVVLADDACGIVETQRVVRWMANESARQCGPCAFGLPALADDLSHLARAGRDAGVARDRLIERCRVIEGRGACRHPDGVVRLVRSALRVFADDAADHSRGVACSGALTGSTYVRVPALEREEELVWE
jgi:NADH:ubiquinone oxidoreductase subunit F (NADH-binding)